MKSKLTNEQSRVHKPTSTSTGKETPEPEKNEKTRNTTAPKKKRRKHLASDGERTFEGLPEPRAVVGRGRDDFRHPERGHPRRRREPHRGTSRETAEEARAAAPDRWLQLP